MNIINQLYTVAKGTAVIILALVTYHWYGIVKYFDNQINVQPYTITEVSSRSYSVDLGQSITNDVAAYTALYDFLKSLSPEDKVNFKIHGYGGSVTSAILVMNGIRETKAHVTGDVESASYSAHGYIACTIPKENLTFHGYGFIMLHAAQSQGTLSRELQEATAGRMLSECVDKGYMTQAEADRLVSNNRNEYYYWPGKEIK